MKLILISVNTMNKKKLTKMGMNTCYLELMFILLSIFQPQKLMKKVILTEILFLRKRSISKKLGCKLIRINTIKEDYDADYEASRIQIFISEFKDRQLKTLNKNVKELEDKINELTS